MLFTQVSLINFVTFWSNSCFVASVLGGADTTVSSTATFLLAMAQNPEVQKKAQGVIDEVIATQGRLPDFTEYRKVPYIEAVIREVFRWRPVTPISESIV